jgi:hypothetical protein
MKKILPFLKTVFIFILAMFSYCQSFSQISVASTNGYNVNISVVPVAIVPTSNSCTWGYNYNVILRYAITFTGNNIPSSLYTLQGTLGCSSASHFFDLPNNGGSGVVNSVSNQWTGATDCNVATVISKSCNTMNIQINGPGISNRTVSFTVSGTVLDVKLISFTAQLEKNNVKLNWMTATETDNDYFTIERSTDGSLWNEIKKVKGSGNSTSIVSYEAYDETPVAGTSYYRLKQTDFDGKASYSSTQSVKFTPASKSIAVFPVPNAGNMITLTGITDYKNQDFTVLNAGGSIVYTTTLSKASVELPVLQPGLYFIRLKDKMSGNTANLRYVKI